MLFTIQRDNRHSEARDERSTECRSLTRTIDGITAAAAEDQHKKDNPPMTPPQRIMGHLRAALGMAPPTSPLAASDDMTTPQPRCVHADRTHTP